MVPVPAQSHREAGNELFKARRWQEAAEQYTLGIDAQSGESSDVRGLLLSNRSQCWLNLKEWQRAFEDSDACLRLLPEHTKSFYRRAMALEQLGKGTTALADYVKVAKADPKNAEAVAAASRLREQVLREGSKRREEALPSHLLEVLRGSTADSDEKVEACKKLQYLCTRQGMVSSLAASGTLEALVPLVLGQGEAASDDLCAAALAVLLSMVSGEAGDPEDRDQKPVAPPLEQGPLQLPAGVQECRRHVGELLHLADARQACRGRPKATARLALVVGFVHVPETTEALEALHDAIDFLEAEGTVNVSGGGIAGLSTMLDIRLRLGKQGRPLMASETLLKCLESALNTSSCEKGLRRLMAQVFMLLGDDDRPDTQKVDLGSLSARVLEPFLRAQDACLRANGLAALESLLAANDKAGASVLHDTGAALAAIVAGISQPQPGADGRRAQQHAAECLVLALGNVRTRKSILDGGGIEMLLSALSDGEEGSAPLLRAKLVNCLAILASHSKDVREEIFDRTDLLMELRFAMDTVREHIASQAEKEATTNGDEHRLGPLRKGLFESCVCLTIHGEFKELLLGAKKTLRSMQELVRGSDLAEDPSLAFSYAALTYNLCRSNGDKVRPKSDQFPFNQLSEEDMKAVEEFYDQMPAGSRPEKNGEVDAGSPELADKFREWCVTQCGTGAAGGGKAGHGSLVVSHLARCTVGGSVRTKNLVAMALKHLCASREHRRIVATSGGLRALLGLVDLADETAKDAARQALAQILIVTNPSHLQYSDQLDAVRPLVELLAHRHELLQFEAAMALTNLCSANEELRDRALQAKGWSSFRDLIFSDNEMVQRAGIEGLCNLTLAPQIVQKFADGESDSDLQIFGAFVRAEDIQTRSAATGALAMLAEYEEVAPRIAGLESFGSLLKAMTEEEDPGVEHRVAAILSCVRSAEGVPASIVSQVDDALRARQRKGFASEAARSIVSEALGTA